jgi:hypothetical protein
VRHSQKDYAALAQTLRELARTDDDLLPGGPLGEKWAKCLDQFEQILEQLDPEFDADWFADECGVVGGSSNYEGAGKWRKNDSRVLILLIAPISLALLGTWHFDAVRQARQQGHTDVYASLCEDNSRYAAHFLPIDENGVPYSCTVINDMEREAVKRDQSLWGRFRSYLWR